MSLTAALLAMSCRARSAPRGSVAMMWVPTAMILSAERRRGLAEVHVAAENQIARANFAGRRTYAR